VVIGEGGSGGALAIGVADRILMLENAIYSVISPEGCASILYRNSAEAPRAAEAMRVTARDLEELKLVEEVIPEPLGGAHHNPQETAEHVTEAIARHLAELTDTPVAELIKRRHTRYFEAGRWEKCKS
jgi:acetyl-CoA carboxylase carboxyl transferase subunit alpha